jgi:hypothetical protein
VKYSFIRQHFLKEYFMADQVRGSAAIFHPTSGVRMPPYDFEVLYESILAAIAAPGTIGERMAIVIDECERQLPHTDWERMRRIDFEVDLLGLKVWLIEAWIDGAVRRKDQGLWFGLFNPGGVHDTTADMYVASGPSYDGESLDWPCEIDLRDGVSYLDSEALDDIYRIAYGPHGGLKNDAEYPLALTYAAIAATTALAQNTLPLELASLRGAAVGFDSGDALFLGVFDNLRFCQQVRPA